MSFFVNGNPIQMICYHKNQTIILNACSINNIKFTN